MKKSFFVLLILCNFISYSQDPFVPTGDNIGRNVTLPNSPEVSALNKYGSYNSNLYTGVANINIPLGTISGREFTIPISLSYNSSGIKVSQMATWVGLGWNLQATGAVSRVNSGKPDDAHGNTSLYIPYTPFYNAPVKSRMNQFVDHINEGQYGILDQDLINYIRFKDRVVKGRYDTQPDYYRFSAPGGLFGKFYIDYENEIGVCLENTTLIIEPAFIDGATNYNASGRHKRLVSFKITDQKGNVYEFNQEEINRSEYVTLFGDPIQYELDARLKFTSAWHLTKITSGINKDVIEFDYYPLIVWDQPQNRSFVNYKKNCVGVQGPYGTPCDPNWDYGGELPKPQAYYIDQVFLKDIMINGVKRAEFFRSPANEQRMDLLGSRYLNRIEIFNNQGNLISSTTTSTDYFTDPANQNPSQTEVRLKLEGVTQTLYGSESLPSQQVLTHLFEYNEDYPMPDRFSTGQDFWGYYNGMDSNIDLVPEYLTDMYNITGAKRNPSENHIKTGMLEKITYPTGGYSTFSYDMHPIGYDTNSQTQFETIGVLQGGLVGGDDYHYHDDSCPGFPNGVVGTFTMNTGNLLKHFRVQTQFIDDGTPIDCNNWSALVIYPSTNNTPDMNEFKTDPSSRYYYREMISSLLTPFEFSVELEDNVTYSYLIMNNSDKYTNFLQKATDANYQPFRTYGGGLRVDQIKNFDQDNNLLGYKRYYYDDFSQALSNPDFENASSAILQQPKYFQELIMEHSFPLLNGTQAQNVWRTFLYRYANNQITETDNTVTYNIVSEVDYSLSNNIPAINGFSVSHFYNNLNYVFRSPLPDERFLNGELRQKFIYNKDKNLVKSQENFYEVEETNLSAYGTNYTLLEIFEKYLSIRDSPNPIGHPEDRYGLYLPTTYEDFNGIVIKVDCGRSLDGPINGRCFPRPTSNHDKNNYYFNAYWKRPFKSITKEYFNNTVIENRTDYFYENSSHRQVTKTERENSKGDAITTQYFYPQDIIPTTLEAQELITKNRITTLIKKSTEVNNLTTAIEQEFIIENDLILPKKIISTKQGVSTTKLIYDKYDSFGNILQTSKSGGEITAYIWGYNKQFPVAKIVNSSYLQATSPSIGLNMNIIDNPNSDEELRIEIDKIRSSLPNAFVTTFTYFPEIGVTSITSPNNQIQYFEYDAPNRLVRIKDKDDKIISDFEYSYKTNN